MPAGLSVKLNYFLGKSLTSLGNILTEKQLFRFIETLNKSPYLTLSLIEFEFLK